MFIFDVVCANDNFDIEVVGQKTIYNIDDTISASKWVREYTKGVKTHKNIPMMKNSIEVYYGKDRRGSTIDNSLGYFFMGGNNVDTNGNNIAFFSTSYYNGNGLPVTKENFNRCISLFTARKVIKKTWINSCDEYLAPNEEHPEYAQFEADSLVISLFHIHAHQSSLNDIEWDDKEWDISNHFFWMDSGEMNELANVNNYDALYKDSKTAPKRHVKGLLDDGWYDKLSPQAKKVLDLATELVRKSISTRELMSQEHPEYHLDSWDAGYAQLKRVWKEYHSEDFKEFRNEFDKLKEEMVPKVYELGFLLR